MTLPTLTKSQAAERLLMLEGKPFSLQDYPFVKAIYDGGYRNILLKTGRQVSKSTTLASLMLIESGLVPYFRTMFLAPTENQSMYFSDTRFQRVLTDSELLRKYLLSGPKVKNNVAVKHFANGSHVIFRYASDNPDRARGFSVDRLCYDEIQDMHNSIFPVINECTAMSDYGYKIYAGTPKTIENMIEVLWQESSQNEWIIKCFACNKWNIPSIENIATKGLICKKCSELISPRDGQWVSKTDNHDNFEGFHIPQIILPWYTENPEQWKEILKKRTMLAPTVFMNEVMGVSESAGIRLIDMDDLKDCCTGIKMNLHENVDQKHADFQKILRNYPRRFMGVDWSGGGRGVKLNDGTMQLVSRTVATVLGIDIHGNGAILAHKIFNSETTQPDSVREIIKLAKLYQVDLIGADAGEGALGNGLLREAFGQYKVIPYRYSGKLAAVARWHKQSECYVVHRTAMIDNTLMLIKRRKLNFSNYDQCKKMFEDILAEYEETSASGERVWSHNPRTPDDSLHSLVFAYCTYRAAMGNLDLQYGEHRLQNY